MGENGRSSVRAYLRLSTDSPLTSCAVLTRGQREIFDKMQAFVLENRNAPLASHYRSAKLSMPNTFPARERKFIGSLSEDLHLTLTWDEYDDEDQNLVTWRFPGALMEEPLPSAEQERETVKEGDDAEGEWEDVDGEDGKNGDDDDDEFEDEESRAAVDRVLKKYDKAPVMDDDEDGGFDARHERSIKAKMDEWKRGYYKVCLSISVFHSHEQR